jgi:hypothetical protein
MACVNVNDLQQTKKDKKKLLVFCIFAIIFYFTWMVLDIGCDFRSISEVLVDWLQFQIMSCYKPHV